MNAASAAGFLAPFLASFPFKALNRVPDPSLPLAISYILLVEAANP